MRDASARLPPWDGSDLAALLTLDGCGTDRYRNRHGDANRNGRSYGGQTLGQATMAASLTVPDDRPVTMLQFLFLQGAVPDAPIEFDVARLQDGKRFSSRQVLGRQAGGDGTARVVFSAQLTFAEPLAAPEHGDVAAALEPAPEVLPAADDRVWEAGFRGLGGYSLQTPPCIDFRIPEIERQLAPETAGARLRFWLKAGHRLPDGQRWQRAAFAYLSDWWLNYSSLGLHIRDLKPGRRLYVASLNHCIWFHHPLRADAWLQVDSESPCAAEGRGLSVAKIHDRDGRLVASATQECLMAYA